ncbi:MAG: GGDEF domain-containing protein [Rhodospirillales bacterium]|nr:GGDEF domain-containing protein [Rhodospirillales bacterium]
MVEVTRPSAVRRSAGGGTGGGGTPRRRTLMQHLFSDMASVLGIPERRLTPEVTQALNALIAEMDHLRAEIEQRDARIALLEDSAAQDSVLPCLNRRAVLRELGRLANFTERANIAGALARLDVVSADALKRRHGLEAADGMMAMVVEALAKAMRQTDVVGSLGGTDLAVVMPQATEDAAARKVESVVTQLSANPYFWHDERVPIEIVWRVRAFVAGETAEQALRRTDPALG